MRSRHSAHSAYSNPEPLADGVFVARFPGQKCTRCGSEFIPGESEISVDPSERGPMGGKRYMHAHGCAQSNPVRRRTRARDLNDMDDMTPSERAEIEEVLRQYYERKQSKQPEQMKLQFGRRPAPDTARRNFGGMFGQKYDLAEHIAVAQRLARPYRATIQNFLVKAPGENGRGEAWYWLSNLQPVDFERASSSYVPMRYFTDKVPWKQMRSTLSEYGKFVKPQFILIDTFTGQVEGPLTEESIQARRS